MEKIPTNIDLRPCEIRFRNQNSGLWFRASDGTGRNSAVTCAIHKDCIIERAEGVTNDEWIAMTKEWWSSHTMDVATAAFEAGQEFGKKIMEAAGIPIPPPGAQIPVPAKLNGRVWLQYHESGGEATLLQSAGSEAEALAVDYLHPGDPWYRYDIRPPGARRAGSLINEAGPFFFSKEDAS